MSPSRDEFSDTDSDSDSDGGFGEDLDALRRASQYTGENPKDIQLSIAGNAVTETGSSDSEFDGVGDEDLQIFRGFQERFSLVPMGIEDEPPMTKPLCTLPPDWSDDDSGEEDYATLRAIQRRFAAYNDGVLEDNARESSHRPVQVGSIIIDSEKETSNSFVERTNTREGFLNCVDTTEPIDKEAEACEDAGGTKPSDSVEWNGPGFDDLTELPPNSSQFPKTALAFVDAIKQNRSLQKIIRSKMTQMEARMEELKKLTERVKILKDFQVACRKKTGRALSQKKDAIVQLISLPKLRANTKLNEKKIPAAYKGPPENAHVAYYKEAMTTFSVNVKSVKWSKEEKENLVKGVKQQFQEMLLQRSVDLLSDVDGSYDPGNVDSILTSIKDVDITPDKIRLFLPKVNWEQLAAMYVPGHSGAECQARFLNVDDPLINHNPWTAMEDKNILRIVQQKGLNNWIDIAASLGTNRTPFQCLARYQRSLNASILKREWTKDEDNQLRTAVETYGEGNWQVVASVMGGRTGTQCSNRWLKTLHPARKRVGKWTEEEDKRLKVAATLFGPKTWRKIAEFVPGRTHVQCRERWVNSLDPSLNMARWTKEEDSKLEMAIEEHGYCWSKVAACIPCRTDNQCWRRWKALFPNEVPMLQEAKKIRRAALISNFVDRESERPALGPSDFRLPETNRITGSENVNLSSRKTRRSSRKTRRSRRGEAREPVDGDTLSGEIGSEEAPRSSDDSEVENLDAGLIPRKKRRTRRSRSINNIGDPSSSRPSPCRDATLPDMSNGNNVKRKPRLQKKGSASSKSKSVDDDPTTSSGMWQEKSIIRPHCDPTEECLLPPTLDYSYKPQITRKKAEKLLPRRRNHDKMAETKKTDARNDHLLPFPDSMSLMEAFREIKAMKRKGKPNSASIHENGIADMCRLEMEQPGHQHFAGSGDDALLSGDLENAIIMPLATEKDENITLASSGSGDDALSSGDAITLPLETEEDDNITLASSLALLLAKKRRRSGEIEEAGPRNEQTVVVEDGDEKTTMKRKGKANNVSIRENGIADMCQLEMEQPGHQHFAGSGDDALSSRDFENAIIMPLETEEDENITLTSSGSGDDALSSGDAIILPLETEEDDNNVLASSRSGDDALLSGDLENAITTPLETEEDENFNITSSGCGVGNAKIMPPLETEEDESITFASSVSGEDVLLSGYLENAIIMPLETEEDENITLTSSGSGDGALSSGDAKKLPLETEEDENTTLASSGSGDDALLSRDSENAKIMPLETEEDDVTLASSLALLLAKKRRRSGEIEEAGSRNDQTVVVEDGDDNTTLSVFFSRVKKRKTDAAKMQ